MTVSYYQTQQPIPHRRPWRRILAIGVSVGVALAAVIVLIAVAVSGNSDDAEDAYIEQVRDRVDVAEQDRQAFVDAGWDLCGVAGDDAASDSRQKLVDHGLGDYANQWAFISRAAATHLC